MPNPWVSLRCDQLIPVNKALNKKEQLEKGLKEEEEEKKDVHPSSGGNSDFYVPYILDDDGLAFDLWHGFSTNCSSLRIGSRASKQSKSGSSS
jgi:hypothetical protein